MKQPGSLEKIEQELGFQDCVLELEGCERSGGRGEEWQRYALEPQPVQWGFQGVCRRHIGRMRVAVWLLDFGIRKFLDRQLL